MSKLDNMVRFLPDILRPSINPNIRGLLTAWGESDDTLVTQIDAAKDQIFVKNADFNFLDLLGSNVGVFRNPDFNLPDDTFRDLIPLLSYSPKQVKNTIQLVLDVFFGVGNSDVFELNANEIVLQIPSTIPGIKGLKGAFHLSSYSGTINSIDSVFNTITIDLEDSTQSLQIDELANAKFGQNQDDEIVLSNTAGTTGVVLQFATTVDLTVFTVSGDFNVAVPVYFGSYIPDKTASFTLRSLRGVLGQTITAGQSFTVLQMTDASSIPDEVGTFILNFGTNTQEGPIDYFSRPNNTTLFIDPSFVFTDDHSISEPVNVVSLPYTEPNIDGTDYSAYLSDITSSVTLAQEIVDSITAAGVVIRVIFTS